MLKKNFVKLIFSLITLFIVQGTACAAKKQSSFDNLDKYVSIGGSYAFYSEIEGNFVGNKPKKKFFGNVAIGGGNKRFYLELEEVYYKNNYSTDIVSGVVFKVKYNKLKYLTTFLNGYLYFKDKFYFDPFIGGGVGISFVKNETFTVDPVDQSSRLTLDETAPDGGVKKRTDFAYQAIVGVSKELSSNFFMEARLRWFSPGNFENNTDTEKAKGRFNNGVVSLSLKYVF